MQKVRLGQTNLIVSRMCFGTLTMSKLQAGLSVRDGARLLVHAYERGVNFLDTAELYETYPHIREALRDAPDYIVSSKAYCYDEETARASFEGALRGIGRDYVDLFMLHEQESIHTLRGHERALNYLIRQKELGHLGAVGISTHHIAAVLSAPTFGGIEVIHPIINYRGLGIADGGKEEMETAIRRAKEIGCGIFAMKPLGGGHFTEDRRAALSYILGVDFLDSIAVGMQRIDEIDYNVALFNGEEPDSVLEERLRHQKRRLMIHDWCEGCGRCVKRCRQNALYIVDGHAVADDRRCVLCGYCASVCPQFCIKVI